MGDGQTLSDQTGHVQNRWLVIIAAIVLNLALGALYSWPVFANFLEKALAEPDQWKNVQTQLVFSMATVFLAVGVIVAGQLSEYREPRFLILLSGLLTGGGYILAGVLPLNPLLVTSTLGVLVGFGIGVAYTLPISLAAKWFPDHRGLATGLAMAGFGIGSVVWSQVFDLFLAERLGIRATFVVYGAIFGALILATIRFLRNPPPGYTESVSARDTSAIEESLSRIAVGKRAARPQNPANFSRREILTQRQLYFLFYTFMVGAAVGLLVIGMSKTYPIERLVIAGHSIRIATNVTRIGALVLFPVFNGFGRVVFGWLSDRWGWKPIAVGSYIFQAAILFLFPWLMSIRLTVTIALPLLAMCYGGNFTIFPLATGQIWGGQHLAANYSLVFLAFGIGALVGPPLGGLAKDAGMVTTAFIVASIMLAFGALLVGILKRPER